MFVPFYVNIQLKLFFLKPLRKFFNMYLNYFLISTDAKACFFSIHVVELQNSLPNEVSVSMGHAFFDFFFLNFVGGSLVKILCSI